MHFELHLQSWSYSVLDLSLSKGSRLRSNASFGGGPRLPIFSCFEGYALKSKTSYMSDFVEFL
jgi:hypothetical protein